MAEFEGIHPDEGTIHAWLDDALDASGSARVEAHIATCAECAERVAEARGLIAGASRVVGLLDETPLPLIRPATSPTNDADLSVWRLLRVTPARAAIAAVLLVAVGITLTRNRIAVESTAGVRADSAAVALSLPAEDATAPMAASAPDSVLGSAVARRIAQDQPPRAVAAAPGVSLPEAPAPSAANVPTLNAEPAREVAAGKSAERLSAVATSAASADKVMARASVAEVAGAGCYRLSGTEPSPDGWSGITLPADISLTPARTQVDVAGTTRRAITDVRSGAAIGSWAQLGGDTLSLTLRGATATTTGLLAPNRSKMVGTLSMTNLASQSAAPAASVASKAQMARPRFDAAAMRSVKVVAKRIDCP